jgi:hypothetical protein
MSLAADFRSTLTGQSRRTTLALLAAWRHMHVDNLDASFASFLASAVPITAAAQLGAARLGVAYVTETVRAAGETTEPAPLDLHAFAGHTADGAPLASVYTVAGLIDAKQRIAAGDTPAAALAQSFVRVARLAQTEVADAGRGATQASMSLDPHVTGYVREARGNGCSRCVILAGKEYRWSDGFDRHPRCHCVHVPVVHGSAPKRQDPQKLFDRLSRTEQDRTFTPAGAKAIRAGADIGSVVNIGERAGLTVAGGRATLQGTTIRSLSGRRLAEVGGTQRKAGSRYRSARAPRLTPQGLLEFYGHDRDRYIAALWRNGYIIRRTPEVVAALERTAV